MSPLITVPVTDLRAGDVFPGEVGYTILTDAERRADGSIEVQVQFTWDGTRNSRVWEDTTHLVQIDRA
jgi:hypothetical protein